MNSLILCEGKTDCILLQYYMEKVYSWERKRESNFHVTEKTWSNLLEKGNNTLIISETKGSSRIVDGVITAIRRNENAAPGSSDEFLDRIMVFTDNDEENTPDNIISKIKENLHETSASLVGDIQRDKWINGEVSTLEGRKKFDIYVMFIPFDENGALETYLLNGIADNDAYDKTIIEKSGLFVDAVDPEEKYLKHRRLMTKAKFDIYFSVRTPVEQYPERQSILKSVAWENYDMIRKDFKVFGELG